MSRLLGMHWRFRDNFCRSLSRYIGLIVRAIFWRWRRHRFFRSAGCRDRSRHVASCRDCIELRELHDLCDVARDRLRRHQILVAHCRRYLSGVEMTAGAIALQTSKRSWVPGSLIAFGHVFERQGKVRVVVCRVLSRQVATRRDGKGFDPPCPQCTRCIKRRRCYPQRARYQERTHEHALRCYPCATHSRVLTRIIFLTIETIGETDRVRITICKTFI